MARLRGVMHVGSHTRDAGGQLRRPAGGLWRRALDAVVAVPVLITLSPLLALIAVAIEVESRGPLLFRQERIDIGGGILVPHSPPGLECLLHCVRQRPD
jgi:lipopolysaccharide/colanic/teichoic acid biosynthesis glycosyltransferase